MNREKGGTKKKTKLLAFKEKEKRTILEEKDKGSKIAIEA